MLLMSSCKLSEERAIAKMTLMPLRLMAKAASKAAELCPQLCNDLNAAREGKGATCLFRNAVL